MKKLAKSSLFFMILGLIFGVFSREFTKITGYTGTTAISTLHTHALALGMLFFLIVLALEIQLHLTEHPRFNRFYYPYVIGLCLVLTLMLIRGILQVLGTELSAGLNASISGIAGLGHITLTVGLSYFMKILFDQINAYQNKLLK